MLKNRTPVCCVRKVSTEGSAQHTRVTSDSPLVICAAIHRTRGGRAAGEGG